jgi:hypothetical protein
MLGSWVGLLYRFHPALCLPIEPQQPQAPSRPTDPSDLRHQIPSRQEQLNDVRNLLANPQQQQNNTQQGAFPRGRGRPPSSRGFFIPPTNHQQQPHPQSHLYYPPQPAQQQGFQPPHLDSSGVVVEAVEAEAVSSNIHNSHSLVTSEDKQTPKNNRLNLSNNGGNSRWFSFFPILN